MLTADCGNSSYGNLDICDRLLNGSASPAASAPTAAEPTVTIPPAAVLPAATTSPAAATSPAATTSPADTGEVTTQRSVYLPPYFIQYAVMRFHCAAVTCCSLAETGDNICLLLLVVLTDSVKCACGVQSDTVLHKLLHKRPYAQCEFRRCKSPRNTSTHMYSVSNCAAVGVVLQRPAVALAPEQLPAL